jgi:ribosomal protein L12E/L44/L45/RPP1/RPP2
MIGNRFWNTSRVSNFLRELGVRPVRWQENIAHLAKIGEMSVEEFLVTDPISYSEIVWPYQHEHHTVKKIIGIINYHEMLPYYTVAQQPEKPVAEEKTIISDAPVTRDTLQSIYENVTVEFEDAYSRVKHGECTWEEVNEIYKEMDEAAMAVANYDKVHASATAGKKTWEEADAAGEKAAEALLKRKEAEEKPKKPLIEEFEQVKTKWACPTCSAVWRTKAKSE